MIALVEVSFLSKTHRSRAQCRHHLTQGKLVSQTFSTSQILTIMAMQSKSRCLSSIPAQITDDVDTYHIHLEYKIRFMAYHERSYLLK